MSKRIDPPRKTTGYGFVGAWQDGEIGWWLPEFLHSHNRRSCASGPSRGLDQYCEDNRTFLCKITIEPVMSKPVNGRSRPITRIVPAKKREE